MKIIGDKMNIKIGDKIRIIYMDGEPSMTGVEGTVRLIDDMKQIHCKEFGLAIIPEVDKFEVIN